MHNRCYGLVMSVMFLCALFSQVYIPFTAWHVYFLECALLSMYLIVDAIGRRASVGNVIGYVGSALVLAPLVVPRWYANRPLKPGECRKGGVDANFFTAFGIVAVVYTGVSAACNFLAFGPERGFELIINSGFAVAGTAIVLGLATRQERVLEKGPVSWAKRNENS